MATKKEFLAATKYWLEEGKGMTGCMHPDEIDGRKEDADLVIKKVLALLRNLPAGEFRNIGEFNHEY